MQAVDFLVEQGLMELNECLQRHKTRTHIQQYTVDRASSLLPPKPELFQPPNQVKKRDPLLLEFLKAQGKDSPVHLKVLDDFEQAMEKAQKDPKTSKYFEEGARDCDLMHLPIQDFADPYSWKHLVKGAGYSQNA